MVPLRKSLVCISTFLSFTTIMVGVERNTRTDWKQAEELAENAVVQVHSAHTEFNWAEPYKAPRKTQSFGTAFFLDERGYLLTNFHVIDQATLQLYIPALGQKPVEAFVVGACPEADIAYIKVSDAGMKSIRSALKKIPYLKLGDSDALFATEPVLALGYPLGQRYLKSTVGVIAGREYISGASFMHITAPINHGNSGGPLLNLDGEVVGINSAGHAMAKNIGYIIPIYDAQILMKELKSKKLVRKPYLGMGVNQTTDAHARVLGNPEPAGVYINTVEHNSLAAKAGVRAGDMLYAINDCEVDSYGDVTVNWKTSRKVTLAEYLIRQAPHTTLNLTLYRNGAKKDISIAFEPAHPDPIRTIYAEYEPKETDYEVIGGMCIMQLRENHIKLFEGLMPLLPYSLKKNQHKEVLIITRLMPRSIFEKINCFYEGALLKEINGKRVKTLAQAREALKESAKTGYVVIKTKDQVVTAITLDELLEDEKRLTQEYKFETTPGAMALMKVKGRQKSMKQ